MSFDSFSPDPSPPERDDLHDVVVAHATRRLTRRRALFASATAVVLLAAALPLALRDGKVAEVRTDGGFTTQPTETAPVTSVPLATFEPPQDDGTTTTTVAVTKPTVASPPTTVPRPASPCVPTEPIAPANRGRIAFSRQPDESAGLARPARVYVVNSDGSGLQQVTDGQFDISPSWAPGGNRIVFTRDAKVHVMKADGTGVVALTEGPDAYPAWSADGKQIAFVRWNPFALMVIGADGSGLRTVLETPEQSPESPSWTPDGCRIVFSLCCTQRGIWSVRPDGTGLTQLRPTGYGPKVGPDGRIVYGDAGSNSSGRSVLFVAAADGSNAAALGQEGGRPTWSPDGSRIAFERWTGEAWNIASVRADGTDPRAATTAKNVADLYAAW